MPPRATTPEETVMEDEALHPSKIEAKTMMQPSVAKSTINTFHWELNVYCAAVIGAVYFATPEPHRLFLHIILGLLALDATRYYYLRGSMTGVPYTLPFVNLIAMLIKPERFWKELGQMALGSEGLCANTMVGNFMVFVTEPKLCRHIMTTNDTYQLYAHPNAYWLFDPKNLIYLEGDVHKKVRSILTPALFSDKALAMYAKFQEQVCRDHLRRLMKDCKETGLPFNSMVAFRTLGAASSQESFLGPYLTDELRLSLEQDILVFTMGFLSFPFPYAGGLKKALECKFRIEKIVFDLVPKAREYVQAGNPPRCLLEEWAVSIGNTAKEDGVAATEVFGCTDDDVARTVLDFLFAAQDATNSGLVYALDVMNAYPDVLDKLRAEVVSQCGESGSVADKINEKNSLPYLSKVANQLLHHKPPVPMVPHLVLKDTELAGYKLNKGSVVIPSITYSARSTGHSLEFLPERDDQDTQFVKTVVFGAGAHKCPGRKYAESLLTVFLAVLAQEYQVERTGPRPGPDDFIYYPTVFPSDANFILKARSP